jgi:PhnB protein
MMTMTNATRIAPEGLTTVTPYLCVTDTAKLTAFLEAAFDATPVHAEKDDRGRIRHAQYRIGNAMVYLGLSEGEYLVQPGAIYMYVADADATYAAALRAGARSLYPLTDTDYGNREGGVVDPAGVTWFIAHLL